MNLKLAYMYRDAANYKSGGAVILTGMPTVPLGEFQESANALLQDGENFVAAQIGLEDVFHFVKTGPGNGTVHDDIDHGWHELCEWVPTNEAPTDTRTPDELLAELQAINHRWEPKEPQQIIADKIRKEHEALARKKLGEHRKPITL